MESILLFEQTEMYKYMNEVNDTFDLGYDLTIYNQEYFWKSDEDSYLCFLKVLKNDVEDLKKKGVLTRSSHEQLKSSFIFLFEDLFDMFYEKTKDEVSIDDDTSCWICTINKNALTLQCCNHEICNKCHYILTQSSGKCPFCRTHL